MEDDLEQTDSLLAALARSLGIEPQDSGDISEDADTDLDQLDVQNIPKAIRAAVEKIENNTPPESRKTWLQVVAVLNKAANDIDRIVQIALKV